MKGILDLDTIAGSWPWRTADISLQRLLGLMDRHGVAESCLVSARGIHYCDIDGNTETLAWCAANTRFTPVGTIDLRRFTGYRDEIRRLARAGVRLWRLFPEHQGWTLEMATFRRVLNALGEAGAVLFMNGQPSAVVRATAGSAVPVILGVHFYQMADLLAVLEEGVDLSVCTRQLHGPGALETLIREMGSDRLVFGSGAPLSAMGAALQRVATADLEAKAREAILGGNLRRLLGKDER
jgi:predicted TIM-barrel fold metal-dependent hydrolase